MTTIDIDRELRDLAAQEELLGFFDFILTVDAGDGPRDVEGLCKVSQPRARPSRAQYVSLFFVVDAQDEATRSAIDAALRRVDWNACAERTPGVDSILAIPHRDSRAGLWLKEVDVYLDDTRAATIEYLRDVLRPALARAMGVEAGEVTVWERPQPQPATQARPPSGDGLVARVRRLMGLGAA